MKLAERVRRFFEAAAQPKFLSQCDPAHDAHSLSTFLQARADDILKFRVVIVTDYVLSDRVKSIAIESISGTKTSVEIWDLSRLFSLVQSETQTEPFVTMMNSLGLRACQYSRGRTCQGRPHIAVMPGEVLSCTMMNMVRGFLRGTRTFLDFRGNVNRGYEGRLAKLKTFAYNNGITLTADSVTVRHEKNILFVNDLENLRIVNGGQTTAVTISLHEAGGVQTPDGLMPFKGID